MRQIGRISGAMVVLLVFGSMAAADDLDHVLFMDTKTKKPDQVSGKLDSEGPGGVKIIVKKGKDNETRVIKAEDIIWIQYQEGPLAKGRVRLAYGDELNGKDKKYSFKKREEYLENARSKYEALEREYTTSTAGKRDSQYNVARVLLLLARNAEDPKLAEPRMEDALKKLTEFKNNHKFSWQAVLVLKALAAIHDERGEMDGARKAYEDLASLPDVPDELRQESELLVGKLLLRGEKSKNADLSEAEKRLAKLQGELSGADPRRPFVEAYLLEAAMRQGKGDDAEKKLAKLIADNPDAKLRGVAYNLLGDYYRTKGKNADAFWSYIRVDVQYGEDVEERAKALWHLADLFVKVRNDTIRGKACLTQLTSEAFAQTRYGRMAKAATKE